MSRRSCGLSSQSLNTRNILTACLFSPREASSSDAQSIRATATRVLVMECELYHISGGKKRNMITGQNLTVRLIAVPQPLRQRRIHIDDGKAGQEFRQRHQMRRQPFPLFLSRQTLQAQRPPPRGNSRCASGAGPTCSPRSRAPPPPPRRESGCRCPSNRRP